MATRSTTAPEAIGPAGDSGAGWSERGGAPSPAETHRRFGIDAVDEQREAMGGGDPAGFAGGAGGNAPRGIDRYEDLDIAGEGAMGTVVVVHDHRLGRDVALKRIAPGGDAALAGRLTREAWIAARLEHPAIVPVYDAGEGPDGRYFTMRLIRGHSLAEVLAAAGDLDARMALLRHFLAVCHAIAYAHGQGIVHRDLKPANVMVGAFGETQVVDWGLAGFVAEASPAGDPAPSAGVVGTPAYMSPEQAAGAPVDRRFDVWALGAVLHELLTGQRLFPRGDGPLTVRRLRAGKIDRARLRAAPVASELRAIADKALAAAPGDRYPDAAALSADVERYLDGRRVEAHAYTTVELIRRVVRAWRLPLAVVAAALVVGAAVLAIGWRRVAAERGRAVTAEHDARGALATTREHLTVSLESQAVAALADGAIAEAELLAAAALSHRESADARGVLAATLVSAHPIAVDDVEIPGCDRVVPDDAEHALCLGDDFVAAWTLAPPRERWRHATPVTAMIGLGDAVVVHATPGHVLVLGGARGDVIAETAMRPRIRMSRTADGRHALVNDTHDLVVIDAAGGLRTLTRPCGEDTLDAAALADHHLAAVCGAHLRVFDDDGRLERELALPFGARLGPAYAATARGDRVAIGGVGGEIVLVDLARGEVGPARAVIDEPVADLILVGDHVLVRGDAGGATLFDPDRGAALLRLPARSSTWPTVAGALVLTGGARLWRWRLPVAAVPRRFAAPAGLSGAVRSPDGALIAGARGDGAISVWRRATGELIAEPAVARSVVKRVDFAADGATLAVALSASPIGSAVLDVGTWRTAGHLAATRGTARVAYLAGGELWGVHYGAGLTRWDPRGVPTGLASPVFLDAAVDHDRRGLSLITAAGTVWRLRDGALREVVRDPGAIMVAGGVDDQVVVTGHLDGVRVHELATGERRWLRTSSNGVTDVAVTADGALVVAGTRAGTIEVWTRAGVLRALLRGHRQRVSTVEPGADGVLVSASWDGTVLLWDLSATAAAPGALIEAARASWGHRPTDTVGGWRR